MIEGAAEPGRRLRAGRRAVLTISSLAFVLDLLYGMVVPTFSLYVTSLGGSELLIGVLAATVGLTELVGAFPVGSLSDRIGRKTAFVVGSFICGLASLLVTVPSDPLLLIFPRILFGIALLATFPVGVAYLADTVAPSRRALAIGIYVSAQGLGFTLGPILGGWIASKSGFTAVYYACAAIGLVATVGGWIFLEVDRAAAEPSRERLVAFRRFLRGPILGAGVANTFMLLMANGAVLPFLSLYAETLGLGAFGIGLLYAFRSGASVLARVPASLAAGRVSNGTLVLLALAVDAVAAVVIGLVGSPVPLFVATIADGIAFGVFMTSGQCIVADEAPSGRRGAAVGSFAAAGALGETVGALLFGVLAHAIGLQSVFIVAGILLALCIPVVVRLLRWRRSPTEEAAATSRGHPRRQPAPTTRR